MSVIRFSNEEINTIESGLLQELNRQGSGVWYAVRYAPITQQQLEWSRRANKGEVGEERVLQERVGRLMWYAWIANKTAYALQYQEEPGFFEDDTTQAFRRYVEKRKLYRDMQSLSYNMVTNDGNSFLSPEWKDLFDRILNAITRDIAEGAIERKEATLRG